MTGENEGLRERVLSALIALPGGSTRDLARRVGIAESTADYHLRRLAKLGLASPQFAGRTRRWYATAGGFCPVLKLAIPELRRVETVAVARALSSMPVTARGLAERSGVPDGTVRWVTAVLQRTFLLAKTRGGRVQLRDGAERCLDLAIATARCPEWGRCAVSLAWERERGPDAREPPRASP